MMQLFYSEWKTYRRETSIPMQILVLVGILLAVILGIQGLYGHIVFTYDQARDALQAYSIWHDHNIKLLGPATDIPGLFHGVLWYYLLAAAYFILRTPTAVVVVLFTISIGTVCLVGILAQRIFHDTRVTSIAMLLYAFSPLFQTASRWLSNPVVSFLVTPLLLLGMWEYARKQHTRYSLLIGISFGLMIQSEFAFLLLLIFLPFYMLIFHIPWRVKHILTFFVGIGSLVSTFLLAEIKFHGQGIRGALQFLHSGSTTHESFFSSISSTWHRVIDLFTTSFFSLPEAVWFLICIFCIAVGIYYTKSQYRKGIHFLALWIGTLCLFLLFHTGISSSSFLFFPYLVPLVILVSFVLGKFFKPSIVLLLVVMSILLLEGKSTYSYIASNTSPLPAQQGATITSAKDVVMSTYVLAHGQPFTINTITNPLYINSTWAYLYTTYGLPHFGYLPYFAGRSQVGQLGYLPEKQFVTPLRFLIIEPTDGIPTVYVTKITYEEDMVSDLIQEKHFGRYIVQERMFHKNKAVPPLPKELEGSNNL